MQALSDQFAVLPSRLANHLLITVLPLALGLAISIPLAMLAVRNKRLRYPTLTVVSIIQTIPSLALLALMVPVLVGIGSLTMRIAGFDVPALGFYPTVMALTLYSMLPILRNTVTGILDVDPAYTEAARGVGMTPLQSLWKVELPLALPVIIAGVRTATVWTVGIATLATPVGQPCLGNYIFAGLQTRNWIAVLFGCVAAAGLAILLDLLIGGLQRAVDERRPGLGLYSGAALVGIFMFGLIAPTVVHWLRPAPEQIAVAGTGEENSPNARTAVIVVGSKTFTEQYILADLIVDLLREAGFETRMMESLGSTVVFDGLTSGEIDCYVDYSGTIWANHMQHGGSGPPWQVLAEVEGWLAREHNVRSLGSLGFENAYALAMTRARAEELGITSIADLARHAPQLRIGGDYEFFDRPEWRELKAAYGLSFEDRISYDSRFMYDAVAGGDVDVISAFSSDGFIEQYDLVLLQDPLHAIPPYDALLLLSPDAGNNDQIVAALQPLIGAIDVEEMQTANYMVDRDEDKRTVSEAAAWLRDQLAAGEQ